MDYDPEEHALVIVAGLLLAIGIALCLCGCQAVPATPPMTPGVDFPYTPPVRQI